MGEQTVSERYIISGAQLGILLASDDKLTRCKLIDEIVDKQFIGNSNQNVKRDVKNITLEEKK